MKRIRICSIKTLDEEENNTTHKWSQSFNTRMVAGWQDYYLHDSWCIQFIPIAKRTQTSGQQMLQ